MAKLNTPGVHDAVRLSELALEEELDPAHVLALQILNSAIRGRLEVDYDTRRVVIDDVNGNVAMRLFAMVGDPDPDDPASLRWNERCDPRVSDAYDAWLFINGARILNLRWKPERFVTGSSKEKQKIQAAFDVLLDRLSDVDAENAPEPGDDDTDGDEGDATVSTVGPAPPTDSGGSAATPGGGGAGPPAGGAGEPVLALAA